MSKVTAVIGFGSSLSRASFQLVQKDYPDKNPENFATWLATTGRNVSGASLFTAYNQYISACNEAGSLCSTLRVRLSDINLDYNLRLTYGRLTDVRFVREERTEYLTFELGTEASVDFGTITAAVWSGDAYDENGEILDNAAVVISGSKATTAVPVYGVLECTVVEELFEHDLVITPRIPTVAQLESEESIVDELYASTAMLFCNEKISLHEIEMPENFGACSGGYGGGSVKVDPDDEETEEIYQVMVSDIFDYCSGAKITDASVYIDGIFVIGESVQLKSGEHTIRVTADGYTPSNEDDLTENDTFTLP